MNNSQKNNVGMFLVMFLCLTFIDLAMMLLHDHPIEWMGNIVTSLIFAIGYDIGKTTRT